MADEKLNLRNRSISSSSSVSSHEGSDSSDEGDKTKETPSSFSLIFQSNIGDSLSQQSLETQNLFGATNMTIDRQVIIQMQSIIHSGYVIKLNELEIDHHRHIGKGGFGDVFWGLYQKNEVAVKITDIESQSNQDVAEIVKEAKILAQLNHPNCLKLVGIHASIESGITLVTPFYTGGCLNIIRNNYSALHKLRLLRDIANGVAYLAHMGIIHNDIKPENILLNRAGDPVLIDFGNSYCLSGLHQSQGHTVSYSAPEILMGEPVSNASDVYSLGVIIYELLAQQRAFVTQERFNRYDNAYSSPGEDLTKYPELMPVLRKCWDSDPKRRPTAEYVALTLSFYIIEHWFTHIVDLSNQYNFYNHYNLLSSDELRSLPDALTSMQAKEQQYHWCRCYQAILQDEFEVLRGLLTNSLVNAFSSDAVIELINLSIYKNNREILERLLKICTEHHVENCRWTPLTTAVICGYSENISLLLSAGFDPNEYDQQGILPLHYALQNNHNMTFSILLEYPGIKVNQYSQARISLLFSAIVANNEIAVERLLKVAANVNNTNKLGATPLHLASACGYNEIAQLLISHGAAVDQTDQYNHLPLNYASENGHESLVKTLTQGEYCNIQKVTQSQYALHQAAKQGYVGIMQLLVEKGVNIDAIDVEGMTALMWAVYFGQEHAVEWLAERSNLDITNTLSETALYIAVIRGYTTIVQQLLLHGASVNTSNRYGQLAVLNAALKGYDDIVTLLLKYGAECELINHQDELAVKKQLFFYHTPKVTLRIDEDQTKIECLDHVVNQFVDEESSCILLLTGDHSDGKSLTLHHIQARMAKYRPEYKVCYIALNNFNFETLQRALIEHVTETLDKEGTDNILLLLDGYNEITGDYPTNPFHSTFFTKFPSANVILTCRSDFINKLDQSMINCLFQHNDAPGSKSLIRADIRPLSIEEIKQYIANYLNAYPGNLHQSDIYKLINHTQGLEDLLRNRYMLTIFCQSLESLQLQSHEQEKTIPEVLLYHTFVQQWITNHLSKSTTLPIATALTQAIDYCKRLAFAMHQFEIYNVTIEDSLNDIWREFFGKTALDTELRTCCPIIFKDSQYRFINNGLCDYFIARYIFDACLSPQVLDNANIAPVLIVRNIHVVELLVSMLKDDERATERLLGYVYKSRTDPSFSNVGAIAATLLNASGFSFAGLNLAHIRIPGAQLYGAIFNGAILDDADLNGCYLENANLTHASLKQTKFEYVNLAQHPLIPVNSTAMSIFPNRERLVVGDRLGQVYVYDTQSWQSFQAFKTHDYTIDQLAISSNNNYLASICINGKVTFWDLEAGRLLSEHKLPQQIQVTAVTFHPNLTVLAMGDNSGNIRLINATDAEFLGLQSTHQRKILQLAFSEDGATLISASTSGLIHFWMYPELTHKGTLNIIPESLYESNHDVTQSGLQDSRISTVAINARAELIAYSVNGNQIRIVNFNGQLYPTRFDTNGAILTIAFNRLGDRLACSDSNYDIYVWNIQSNLLLQRYRHQNVLVRHLDFFEEQGCLLAYGNNSHIKLWSLNRPFWRMSNTQLLSVAHRVMILRQRNKSLISLSWDNNIYHFDGNNGAMINKTTLPMLKTRNTKISIKPGIMALQPSEGYLLYSTDENILHLIELYSGDSIVALKLFSPLTCCHWLDDTTIITAHANGQLLSWHFAFGQVNQGDCYIDLQCYIDTFTINPSKNQLAIASRDGCITLVDIGDRTKASKQLLGHEGIINNLQYDRLGLWLVSSGADMTACVWNTHIQQQLHVLTGHQDEVIAAAISNDQDYVITASLDQHLRIWDAATGRLINTVTTNAAKIINVIHDNQDRFFCYTSNSVSCWQLRQIDGLAQLLLQWSSDGLQCAGCHCENALISAANARLLEQHGATVIQSEQLQASEVVDTQVVESRVDDQSNKVGYIAQNENNNRENIDSHQEMNLSELLENKALNFDECCRLLPQAEEAQDYQALYTCYHILSHLWLEENNLDEAGKCLAACYIFAEKYLPDNVNEAERNLNDLFIKIIELYTNDETIKSQYLRQPLNWQRYRHELRALRKRYFNTLSVQPLDQIMIIMDVYSEEIRQFLASILSQILGILGEPPCDFTLLSLGSLARNEFCLASDLEFALVYDELTAEDTSQTPEMVTNYIKLFLEIFNLSIICLGETNSFLHWRAYDRRMPYPIPNMLAFDEKHHTAYANQEFIGTVISFSHNHFHVNPSGEVSDIIRTMMFQNAGLLFDSANSHVRYEHYNAMRQASLAKRANNTGICLYEAIALELITRQITTFKEIDADAQYIDIKEDLCRLPSFLLTALCLYNGIEAHSSQTRLNALLKHGLLNEEIAFFVEHVFNLGFSLRNHAHHFYDDENDIGYFYDSTRENNCAFVLNELDTIQVKLLFKHVVKPLLEVMQNWKSWIYDDESQININPFLDPRSFAMAVPYLEFLINQTIDRDDWYGAEKLLLIAVKIVPVHELFNQRSFEINSVLVDYNDCIQKLDQMFANLNNLLLQPHYEKLKQFGPKSNTYFASRQSLCNTLKQLGLHNITTLEDPKNLCFEITERLKLIFCALASIELSEKAYINHCRTLVQLIPKHFQIYYKKLLTDFEPFVPIQAKSVMQILVSCLSNKQVSEIFKTSFDEQAADVINLYTQGTADQDSIDIKLAEWHILDLAENRPHTISITNTLLLETLDNACDIPIRKIVFKNNHTYLGRISDQVILSLMLLQKDFNPTCKQVLSLPIVNMRNKKMEWLQHFTPETTLLLADDTLNTLPPDIDHVDHSWDLFKFTWIVLERILFWPMQNVLLPQPAAWIIAQDSIFADNDQCYMMPSYSISHENNFMRTIGILLSASAILKNLSPHTVHAFCQLNPYDLLDSWLTQWQKVVDCCGDVMGSSSGDAEFNSQLQLPRELVSRLYTRFTHMQSWFKHSCHQNIRHIDLIAKIHPELADICEQIHISNNSFASRLANVDQYLQYEDKFCGWHTMNILATSLDDIPYRTYGQLPLSVIKSSELEVCRDIFTQVEEIYRSLCHGRLTLFSNKHYSVFAKQIALARCNFAKIPFDANVGQRNKFMAAILKETLMLPLTELHLINFSILKDKDIKLLLQHQKQLKQFTLSGCDNISNAIVPFIIKRCEQLHTLVLNRCPGLTRLDLMGSKDNVVFSSLQLLDVSDCPNLLVLHISAPRLRRLVAGRSTNLNIFRLETESSMLDLSYCDWFTDKQYEYLVRFSPNLVRLDTRGCSNLHFARAKSFVDQWPLFESILNKQVKKLSFKSDTIRLALSVVGEILQCENVVEEISIDGVNLTMENLATLKHIIQNGHIKNVSLISCNLDDAKVKLMLESLDHNLFLQRLDISNNCFVSKSILPIINEVVIRNRALIEIIFPEQLKSDHLAVSITQLLRRNIRYEHDIILLQQAFHCLHSLGGQQDFEQALYYLHNATYSAEHDLVEYANSLIHECEDKILIRDKSYLLMHRLKQYDALELICLNEEIKHEGKRAIFLELLHQFHRKSVGLYALEENDPLHPNNLHLYQQLHKGIVYCSVPEEHFDKYYKRISNRLDQYDIKEIMLNVNTSILALAEMIATNAIVDNQQRNRVKHIISKYLPSYIKQKYDYVSTELCKPGVNRALMVRSYIETITSFIQRYESFHDFDRDYLIDLSHIKLCGLDFSSLDLTHVFLGDNDISQVCFSNAKFSPEQLLAVKNIDQAIGISRVLCNKINDLQITKFTNALIKVNELLDNYRQQLNAIESLALIVCENNQPPNLVNISRSLLSALVDLVYSNPITNVSELVFSPNVSCGESYSGSVKYLNQNALKKQLLILLQEREYSLSLCDCLKARVVACNMLANVSNEKQIEQLKHTFSCLNSDLQKRLESLYSEMRMQLDDIVCQQAALSRITLTEYSAEVIRKIGLIDDIAQKQLLLQQLFDYCRGREIDIDLSTIEFSNIDISILDFTNVPIILSEEQEGYLPYQSKIQRYHKLFQAIDQQDVGEVEYQLSLGLDVNWRNEADRTALMVSMKSSDAVVECLLEHGADMTLTGESGLNVIDHVCRRRPERLALLLKHGATLSLTNRIYLNDSNLLPDELTYDMLSDFDNKGDFPIHHAVVQHNVVFVKVIIAASNSANTISHSGYTPLHLAAQHGFTDLIELLLDHHAHIDANSVIINNRDMTPLALALYYGHITAAILLINRNCKYGLYEAIGLHHLVKTKAPDIYFKLGAFITHTVADSINVTDEIGSTPLGLACYFGNIYYITYLLEHGADVNMPADEGLLPLSIAVKYKHSNAAKLLLDCPDVDVDALANRGKRTALMEAIDQNSPELVRLLLSERHTESASAADPNFMISTSGLPILHYAIHNRNADIVTLLIKFGADPFQCDSRGYNAFSVAAELNLLEILPVLTSGLLFKKNRRGDTVIDTAQRNNQHRLTNSLNDMVGIFELEPFSVDSTDVPDNYSVSVEGEVVQDNPRLISHAIVAHAQLWHSQEDDSESKLKTNLKRR